jgi:hypothetical protein
MRTYTAEYLSSFELRWLDDDLQSLSPQEELGLVLRRRWSPDQLQRFLIQNDLVIKLAKTCPECFSEDLVDAGAEIVCKNCGYVVEERQFMSQNLEYGTTYALTSDVVNGKSLGGTLPMKELEAMVTSINLAEVGLTQEDERIIKNILSKTGEPISRAEVQDALKRFLKKIPLTHLRTQLQSLEVPPTTSLKTELTKLLSEYGFYKGSEYNAFDHQLGNMAGVLGERIGRFLYAGGAKPVHDYKRLASAILVWLLEESHPETAKLIREKETPAEEDMEMVRCLVNCPVLTASSRLRKLH